MMNELFVALCSAGFKSLAIVLGIIIIILIIAVYSMSKQIDKMVHNHHKELMKQERKYQELLDEKSSAIRELLAQKRELEENCKSLEQQKKFLIEGKKQKEEKLKSDSEEEQTT